MVVGSCFWRRGLFLWSFFSVVKFIFIFYIELGVFGFWCFCLDDLH